MSTDNTDRTTPQAPIASDDVALSSEAAPTPTARTAATDARSGEATVNLVDEGLVSASLASLASKVTQVSPSASPTPRAMAAQDGEAAAVSAAADADKDQTTDDAAHDWADEQDAADDDEADTLNLREQASFPSVAESRAAEAESAVGPAAAADVPPSIPPSSEPGEVEEEPTPVTDTAPVSVEATTEPAAPKVVDVSQARAETAEDAAAQVSVQAVTPEPARAEEPQGAGATAAVAPAATAATTNSTTSSTTSTASTAAVLSSSAGSAPEAPSPVSADDGDDEDEAPAVSAESTRQQDGAPLTWPASQPTSQPTTASAAVPATAAAADGQGRLPVADTADAADTPAAPQSLIEAEDFEDFDELEDSSQSEQPAGADDLDTPEAQADLTPATPAIPTPATGSPAVRAVPVSVATGAARASNEAVGATPQTPSAATGTADAAVGVDDTDDSTIDSLDDISDDFDGELDAEDVEVGEAEREAGAGEESEESEDDAQNVTESVAEEVTQPAAASTPASASVSTAAAQPWTPVPPASGSQTFASTAEAADVDGREDGDGGEGAAETDDGFAPVEAPAVSAAFAAPSAPSVAVTTPAAPSADSPEPTSSSRSEFEPQVPASAPSATSGPSVAASTSPAEPEAAAPVNADADNRPSAPSWPATPAAQLARTGSAASASSARSSESATSARPAFSAGAPAPTPSTEGMGAAPRTASSPYIGLSDLRPGAPADAPAPAPAGTTPQSEWAPSAQPAPSTQPAPASADTRDYHPTPAASPSAPSPQQTPDWFAAAPTGRGLSASADAGESDDPEERGRSRARQAAMAMTGADEDDDSILLKGASVLSTPGSRVETHWAGVLVAVVLFPLAWFLVHDGAATLTGGNPSAWPSAASPMGALEILGGTAACAAALFMISRSSLGAFIVGAFSTVIGLPFVLMPGVTKSILGPTVDRLQAHSDLGKALSTYVMDDGLSGRFILMGVLTIMVAVVGHLARRAGQRRRDDGHGPRD